MFSYRWQDRFSRFSPLPKIFSLNPVPLLLLKRFTMDDKKQLSDVGVLSDNSDIDAGAVEAQGFTSFDEPATKKLLRKIDWHILPFMSLIYLLAVPIIYC